MTLWRDEKLRAALREHRRHGDGLAEYMRAWKCPPERGWILVLPKAIGELPAGPSGWPDFVRISDSLPQRMLVRAENNAEKAPPCDSERRSP
jgi:hypothetical protein